jgi:hypothetical protein
VNGPDLSALASRLEALGGQPVGGHPAVLDEVHRALVGELERLANVVSGEGPSAGPRRSPDQA